MDVWLCQDECNFVALGPKELWPDEGIMQQVKIIEETGAIIEVSDDD